MNKPVIGIVAKHYKKVMKRADTFIRDEVKQAIFDNGGIAIGILPTNFDKISYDENYKFSETEQQNLIEQINLCDGIILQGGAFSDKYEEFVAKYCYDKDIPIIGICAGVNNMVRALGGKIGRFENTYHNSQETYVHEIKIDATTKLYNIIKKDKIMVNSRHKSYVLDTNLYVGSISNDNLIEELEDKIKKCYMAFQFHPESLYKVDNNMNSIFEYFIRVCKKR